MMAGKPYVAQYERTRRSLPALLAAWAIRLDTVLSLPACGSLAAGWGLAFAGLALMAIATRDLWVHGHGLPASPFPPERLVTGGIYGIVAHPVYVGAVLVAFGVSLATKSGAGLWVVAPVLALSAAAFVIGFEDDSTRRRYGALPSPLLRLPGRRSWVWPGRREPLRRPARPVPRELLQRASPGPPVRCSPQP